jgi:hypothetical protein
MRQLPVIDTINHAITSTKDNIAFAFHVSWPWILVLLPLSIASNLYIVLNNLRPEPNVQPDMAVFFKFLMVSAPLLIASVVAYASIAVNWHRYILKDEMAEGWQRLRVDDLTWRYIGNFILILLLMIACGVGVGVLLMLAGYIVGAILGQTLAMVILVPVMITLYFYAIVATYRLSVKLPAVALGRTDFSMRDAWKATAGNDWRILGLLALFIVCMVIIGLVMALGGLIFNSLGAVGISISIAIQVLVNWLATILGVTLLTSLYGYFVEERNF